MVGFQKLFTAMITGHLFCIFSVLNNLYFIDFKYYFKVYLDFNIYFHSKNVFLSEIHDDKRAIIINGRLFYDGMLGQLKWVAPESGLL